MKSLINGPAAICQRGIFQVNLKTYTLICLQVLSIIATVSIVAPHVLPLVPTVPVVHAVGPNAAVSQLRCLLVVPGPAAPCPDKLPLFESIIYDADNSGTYTPTGGDTVIVGPIPTVGALLSSDPKILYRETGTDTIWNPGETIFYNTNNTVNGRVFLIGNPTGVTGASIRTDPKIKFVDTNGNGHLDGVIQVVATLHNLGGILPDGSEQDIDAIQVVYTYNPAALKVMRATTGGGTLPGQYDRFCLIPVPASGCTGPGKYSWLVDTYCADSGGSALDSITPDETAGLISSSSLCTQGPPRDSDVGIGCDPNYASPIRTGTCPGDILAGFPNIGVPNGPLTDLDVMTVQFMVQVSRGLSFTQVVDATGSSGTKLLDIDGTTSTTICGAMAPPCKLVNASNGPVACFTFSPSAPSSGGTVNFDATCSTDPDTTSPKPGLTYAWDFGDMSPAGSGATPSHMYTCSVSPNCPFTVKLNITDTNSKTDSTSKTIIVTPVIAVKAAPTASLTAPAMANINAQVTFDASASVSNDNPVQTLSYSWSVDTVAQVGATGKTFTTSFSTLGMHTVKVTVCNSNGLCNSASASITINAVKAAPTPSLTAPGIANVKAMVVFDASASVSNDNPLQTLSYSWSVDGVAQVGATGNTFSTSFSTPGMHTVKVTVCNSNGLCASASASITINAIKVAPNVSLTGPTTANIKAMVTFDASGSVDNSNPVQTLSYSWSVDGGPGVSTPGATFTTSFSTPGVHTVKVTVCNTSGLCSSKSVTITITPLVITSFTLSPTPVFATASPARTFTATYSGGTGPYVCTFNFGDGNTTTTSTTAQSCSSNHSYMLTGTFTANVTVVGLNPNVRASETMQVIVYPGPTFAHGKLSWKHHLLSPGPQTFTGKAVNPSSLNLLVRIRFVVDQPDARQDFFNSPTFTLNAGQLRTDLAFTYPPKAGVGKYCFTATLQYGLDTNGNGVLDDSEILGNGNTKSGCFAFV